MNMIIDNNIVNKFYDFETNRVSDVYRNLCDLQSSKKIEIFATPTNVIELIMFKDVHKRHVLCKLLNELIEGRRITFSWEFEVIQDVCSAANAHFGDAILDFDIITNISKTPKIMYQGLLGQMSCIENFLLGDYEETIRAKFQTSMIQLLISSDLDILLENYEENIAKRQNSKTFIEKILSLERKSIHELKEMIDQAKKTSTPAKNISKFQRVKPNLVSFYSIAETRELFRTYFKYLEDMIRVFNIKSIVEKWNNSNPKNKETDIKPLNPVNAERILSNHFSIEDYFYIIDMLIERYEAIGMIPIMNYRMDVYFNEMERTLRDPGEVSDGSVYDIDYVASFLKCDIFYTHDQKLRASLMSALKKFKFDGRENKKVISDIRDIN